MSLCYNVTMLQCHYVITVSLHLLQNEVLQALKDHILETDQQKVYLDGLLSAVIEEAPQILVNVDTRLGLREAALKSNSEELC